MRTRALISLLGLLAASPGALALTEQDCREGHARFLEALAQNREDRLRQVRDALAANPGAAEIERLHHERDQAWDHEEQMRAMADQDRRACLQHVRESPATAR
jgi:hypothetical protein